MTAYIYLILFASVATVSFVTLVDGMHDKQTAGQD